MLSKYRSQAKKAPLGHIESTCPWDTLSVDILGRLPMDQRMEYLVVFVDCYSKYTIMVPTKDHTADTVSQILLERVVPYFGTPRRLLSDRGREFISATWVGLMNKLGIQQVLTSPYHPEGNAINERSHRTIGNIMRALLQEQPTCTAWVKLIPSIMLTLYSMPHAPHHFSASFIATGRENLLPPDLVAPQRFTRSTRSTKVCGGDTEGITAGT